MIYNQWYVILASKEVKKNQVIGVKRLGENLVVWRDSRGNPGAARDKCPHRGIKLSLGKVKDDHLQCPFHGFEYSLDGACKLIPANGKASPVPEHIRTASYPVKEANGFMYLWFSAGPENAPSTERLPWFDDLGPSLFTSEMTDHWKAHYSRVIENQLDVVHVPFIHRTTIGRGIGPVVNGPYIKTFENGLSYRPSNEQDHGQVPLRHDQMQEPSNKSTFLTFLFPNLWQNHIMEKLRVVVAFVPVDETNTILYLRTYQKMVTIPVLRNIFLWITERYNRIILHQDRRVVETHQPQESRLKMGENLIPGDYPVVLYRKRRDELKSVTRDA
ncbi:MAG: aromatic ring-hydroxylating dioxygenase subunit alpha [Bacteroidetes bacterium]|nr:aromatic ring-hydroxylating dioxygenase subunit alpha [Bacteroidota bacterium]